MRHDADSAKIEKPGRRHGDRVLTSWAEIAQYVGRNVRTLKRWEEFYDFPIHHDDEGVQPIPLEIDEWVATPLSFRSNLDLKANHRWNTDVRKDAQEALARGQQLRKQAQSQRAAAQRWHKRA